MRYPWWDLSYTVEQVFAEVWCSLAIAYVWPRHITTRWTTAPRGKSLPLPLPRSWLGGRVLNPSHTHTSLKGATMRRLIASALLLAALTGCAATSTPGYVVPAASALPSPDSTEEYAWEIFDHGGGSSKLRVDPSRAYKVTFMSATPSYPSWAGPDDAVIPAKDGRWYWFAVSYTD